MYDAWEYLVPANTTEANAIEVEARISLGIITDVFIGFPPGPGTYDSATDTTYRLARSRLWHRRSPIVPRSPKGYVAADGYVIHASDLEFEALQGDAVLSWYVWNLDDTYPHELWLNVNWVTKEQLEAQQRILEQMNVKLDTLIDVFRYAFRV